MIKKVDGYRLTSSLKDLVKTRHFSIAKPIDMYDYMKPTHRDFITETFILHVGTNDLTLNKSPKNVSKGIITLAELI